MKPPPFIVATHSPCIIAFALLIFTGGSGGGAELQLGDIDGDQVATVRDIARVVGHIQGSAPLEADKAAVADLSQDGAVNQADIDLLIQEILDTREPESLPLSTVRFSSPGNGEGDVAVTRETIVHFTIPLALETHLDTDSFYAEFGGEKLLTRVELSGDRKKATLFYLEPLPSNARVRVCMRDDQLRDLIDRQIDLDGDGNVGGSFEMTFDTLSISPVASTAVVGVVLASTPQQGPGGETVDVPLPGATITVDGAEETLRTVTAADGSFTLPCPAGTFFVHIDGRTCPASNWPSGAYYPTVGKRWFAVAGRTNNPAGDPTDSPAGPTGRIYLPFIEADALQATSASTETEIGFSPTVSSQFPELEGTALTVPANSLFSDDGTRGGRVGIAPVAPDRLPGPLPQGLELPLVITIQTDGGTNFDRPAPIRLPNLPDPATGLSLEPGAKSALLSYDHDAGEWKVVGPMTATADGQWVETDPGVGILQPGWHGTSPASTIRSYRQIKTKNGSVITVVRFMDGSSLIEKGDISRAKASDRAMQSDEKRRKEAKDRNDWDKFMLLIKGSLRPRAVPTPDGNPTPRLRSRNAISGVRG